MTQTRKYNLNNLNYKECKKALRASYILRDLSFDREYSNSLPTHGVILHGDVGHHELLDCLDAFLFDDENYPQAVYDFASLNKGFIAMIRDIVCMIDNMDETMENDIRKLFENALENMNSLADIEAEIAKEQLKRDPLTNKFIKPRFPLKNLIYTMAIATLLITLECKYNNIMRIDINQSSFRGLNPMNMHPFRYWEWRSGRSISEMLQRQYKLDA